LNEHIRQTQNSYKSIIDAEIEKMKNLTQIIFTRDKLDEMVTDMENW